VSEHDEAAALADELERWSRQTPRPLVVAIDGRGASGKTTLAAITAALLDAAVLHTDDFFRAAAMTVAASGPPLSQNAIVRYYELDRLRSEGLAPLLRGDAARFRSSDPDRDEASSRSVVVRPASIVIVEGVSSASSVLADLVHRRVVVQTPAQERLARLRRLIAPENWDEAWLEAEDRYFSARPDGTFDLVVSGSSVAPT
jgi:uridine kinase